MRKEKLCEVLGIEYRPLTVRRATPVTIRNIGNDETTHFPSFAALAKAIEKNIGSIVWYEKTKRLIPVAKGQSKVTIA